MRRQLSLTLDCDNQDIWEARIRFREPGTERVIEFVSFWCRNPKVTDVTPWEFSDDITQEVQKCLDLLLARLTFEAST